MAQTLWPVQCHRNSMCGLHLMRPDPAIWIRFTLIFSDLTLKFILKTHKSAANSKTEQVRTLAEERCSTFCVLFYFIFSITAICSFSFPVDFQHFPLTFTKWPGYGRCIHFPLLIVASSCKLSFDLHCCPSAVDTHKVERLDSRYVLQKMQITNRGLFFLKYLDVKK